MARGKMGRQRAIPAGEGWMTVVRQHSKKPANNCCQPPTCHDSNNERRERQVLQLMSTANWSDLPNDVLGYLIGFLPLLDYYRFGAVCRNWCMVAREKHYRQSHQLPFLVLGEDIATKKRIFFNLSDNKHYYIDIPELHWQFVCGSSFGWLFTVDSALNIRMLNPFTRKSYNLPRLDLGLEDFPIKCDKTRLVHSVILDHDPNERSNFTVMVISGSYYKVAFWRQGESTWTSAINLYDFVTSITFFKGQFYAVGCDVDIYGEHQLQIFIVDVGPDSKLIPLRHHVPMIKDTYNSLVDFNGELLLLQWKREMVAEMYNRNVAVPYVTTYVDSWKLDFEEGIYSKFKHFNNHTFFVGRNSPVVIDPSQFSGCTQNAIYFANTGYGRYSVPWNFIEIYNLVKNNSARYYAFKNLPSEYVAPIWLAPNP